MRTPHRHRRLGLPIGLLLASSWIAGADVGAAHGQLRPYDPLPWELFDDRNRASLSAGTGVLAGQRASLAGYEGTLIEAGILSASMRTGRVVLGGSGTLRRYFRDERRFADPAGDAQPATDARRKDSGDYIVSTTLLLTPRARPLIAVLRFGSRLPTTDNRTGLERDQTDFFALLGGRGDYGPVRATAELGVGIHGTRMADFEQSDVFVYLLGIGLPRSPGAPTLLFVGHADGLDGWTIRGNENLSELRARFRTGGRFWLQLQGVVGLASFSPGAGASLMAGATF